MSDAEYQVIFGALLEWNQAAMGKGGTTTETVGRVNSAIITTCRVYPESLISEAPNRIVGTAIYWTARSRP